MDTFNFTRANINTKIRKNRIKKRKNNNKILNNSNILINPQIQESEKIIINMFWPIKNVYYVNDNWEKFIKDN